MSALVGVIMGSKSDWSTLSHTADMLEKLGIPDEVKVVSAHRTPDLLFQYADEAESRGIEVIIAGAGGAAHLPRVAKVAKNGAIWLLASRLFAVTLRAFSPEPH